MVNWYALRWLVETVMSVAKRRWGEALSARTDLTQRSQALLGGVVYNVNRLVLLGISA
ncbi:transposase [Azospirillum sp. A1-3]|uniref:transposase n=1 Tax=Azospirillum sp. A1-3 TaxID=185874 RepID=UPI00336BCE93